MLLARLKARGAVSRKLGPILVVLAAGWLVASASLAGSAQVPQAPADGGRRAFAAALARYADLRTTLEDPLPSFEDPRRDPWTLVLMRRYLAAALRSARRNAEIGCIFGPAADLFRGTLAETGGGVAAAGVVDDEFSPDGFEADLAVNEPVPAWALTALSPVLLQRLPPLPAAIEYQRVGTALILWDARAEILVDALPDAFSGLTIAS